MSLWARLQNMVVAELTTTDPAGRFHPSLRWQAVPDRLADWVEPGWRLQRQNLVPPSPGRLDQQIADRVADRRWRAESGGLTVQGLPIRIDDKTEARVGRAARVVAAGRTRPVVWKLADGRFAELGAPRILALDAAITAHLEACFARENTIMTAVRAAATVAGKIAAYSAAIDDGWPDTEPGIATPPGQPGQPGQAKDASASATARTQS